MAIASTNVRWSDLYKESHQSAGTDSNLSIASTRGIRMMRATNKFQTHAKAVSASWYAEDNENQNHKASNYIGCAGATTYLVNTPRRIANFDGTDNAYYSGPAYYSSGYYIMPDWIDEQDIILMCGATSYSSSSYPTPVTSAHNGQNGQPWVQHYRNYSRYGSKNNYTYRSIQLHSLQWNSNYGRFVKFNYVSGTQRPEGLFWLIIRSRASMGVGTSFQSPSLSNLTSVNITTTDNGTSSYYADTATLSNQARNVIRLMIGNVSNSGYDSNPTFGESGSSNWSSFTQFQGYGDVSSKDLIWWYALYPQRDSSNPALNTGWNPAAGNNYMATFTLEILPRVST